MLKRYSIFIFTFMSAFLLTGCSSHFIINSNTKVLRKEDAKELKLDKTRLEPITRINIATRLSDIEILPADDYYVEIDYTYWEEDPIYSVEDGELTFEDMDSFPNSYSLNFSLDNVIKVYLPETAILTTLDLKDSSGDIRATGFNAKDMELVASYGDLTLTKAAAADTDITLSCGKSKLEDFNAGTLRFKNSYGNSDFKNINTSDMKLPDEEQGDSVEITLSCGDCFIDGFNGKALDVVNSYGDITCKEVMADELNTNLSCGDLVVSKSGFKEAEINNSYGDAELSLNGSEADYSLDLNTSYGDIKVGKDSFDKHLNRDNKGAGNISANLSSGNIKIEFTE